MSDKAKEAMLRRSREKAKGNNMNQYYAVMGFFCASMVAALMYTLLNPQQNFANMPVIDDASILIHNGGSNRFEQANNEFFVDFTMADAKRLFEQGLSDNPQINSCKSGKAELAVEIPDSYDWRDAYPECVQEPQVIPRNCSATYIYSSLSATEDRICMKSQEKIRLSAQEIIDCDKTNNGCQGGNVNMVLTWGKRRGFLPETCYPLVGDKGECPDEHLTENSCRQQNNLYKVIDFCLANEIDGVKKEILANGPVLGQMTPYTDFLTYKEGIYSRTTDAFKFNGNHIVKVIGWENTPDGSSAWIVQNTWGLDWGEDGYAKIGSGGETMLDFYAIGFAAYPTTMADYYAQQSQPQMTINQKDFNEIDDSMIIDLDNDIFNDSEPVVEEGIDTEL